MSLKGTNTTSDYIEYDRAVSVAEKLLKEDGKKVIGLYIMVAVNTGLRIGDILNLKFSDLKGDTLKLTEQKTGKKREIKLNERIRRAIESFGQSGDGFVFVSQKGVVYARQSINVILKEEFAREAKKLNISSHSLRKAMGRKVFENNGESEKALTYLSELFNHASPSITRKYLGIRQEELNNIYDCLV
jgi:integrase